MSPIKSLRALFISLPLFLLSARAAVVNATVVNATWNSAANVPVTTASYTATPFPMTASQTAISGDGKLELEFASPDNAAFYRLLAE